MRVALISPSARNDCVLFFLEKNWGQSLGYCSCLDVSFPLTAAEKVTENLAEMTGQVAPCDVSSLWGIRRAMGIAVPAEPPESFIDLTTGE